jgi:hypothetical protein
MQNPNILSKVPNPLFPSVQDITLYTLSKSLAGPTIIGPNLRTSCPIHNIQQCRIVDIPVCLRRLITGRSKVDSRLFQKLDHVIRVTTANDYELQKLDTVSPLTDPPIERSSPGNIAAGNYLIRKFP